MTAFITRGSSVGLLRQSPIIELSIITDSAACARWFNGEPGSDIAKGGLRKGSSKVRAMMNSSGVP